MFEAILQEQGMRTDITKHKKNSWFMYEVSMHVVMSGRHGGILTNEL